MGVKAKKKVGAKSGRRIPFFNILFGIVLVAALSSIVFSYVSLTELTTNIQKKQKELDTLQSDAKRLNVEIDRKLNLKEVERIAVDELSMSKIEKYQIQYVNLNEEDKVEIVKDQKKENKIIDGIVRSFNIILEYLS